MKKNLTKMMMIALLAIFPLSIFAQSAYQKKYFYMGVEGGLSVYHGDLSNYKVWWQNIGDFNMRHLAFDGKLTLGYQFGGVVGMNLKLGYVGFSGEKVGVEGYAIDPRTKWFTVGAPNEEAEIPDYNTYEFSRTHALDASLNVTFDLCNLIGGYKYNRVFHFVPHVGVGALMFTPQSVYGYNLSEDQVKLTPDNAYQSGDEVVPADGEGMFGKPMVTMTLPVGAEMYFRLHRVVDLFVDYTYNFTFTDKIDRMTKGVDEKFLYNDKWGTVNLGLRFKFVKRVADIERMAKEAGQITYTVTPDPLEEHDGKIECDVEVKIPAKYFEKEATMTLTPYVNYNGKQIELEPITFIGEKVKNIPGTQVNYKNGGTFTFHNTFDYDFSDDEGMKNATINGTPMFADAVNEGHTAQGAEQVLYKGGIVRTTPYEYTLSACTPENGTITLSQQGEVAAGTTITVTAEPVKDGSLESLYYTVDGNTTNITNNTFDMPNGNTVVCATFKLAPKPICTFHFKKNSAKLENTKANKEAAKVIADKLAEGANITFNLEGWASPEGEGDHNQELSENRAKAVEKAVKDQLKKAKLNADNFNINTNGNGADWSDNFLNAVQNSSIKDKDAIVNVVKGLAGKNVAQKEQEIRNMINVYPELEKEILPQLRRAEVFVK
jgi:hypothetical protein